MEKSNFPKLILIIQYGFLLKYRNGDKYGPYSPLIYSITLYYVLIEV